MELKSPKSPKSPKSDGFSDSVPLDLEEVQGVSAAAFKEAYDYYKKNAVGDPKTREDFLAQLRGELAEYEEGDGGTKNVKSGILKDFTDENYKIALASGQNIVGSTLKNLSGTEFPDFESFGVARKEAADMVDAQLLNNVAYPELSEGLLKGLEELSAKVALQFDISAAVREKEKLLMEGTKKSIEQLRKKVELQEALMNSHQMQTNVVQEKKLLAEQDEKQRREWKARLDRESKFREKQITAEFSAGFSGRAQGLQAELADSADQTKQMMLQMQREAQESQAKLTQLLLAESSRPLPSPPVPVEPRSPGLLTSLLTPVTGLLDGLLAPVTGLLLPGLLGGPGVGQGTGLAGGQVTGQVTGLTGKVTGLTGQVTDQYQA